MSKCILAVGELNVDLIMTGLSRLPELGREVLAEDFEQALGSSTAICASGLAALGRSVVFFGKVGDDAYGRFSLDALSKNGVDTSRCILDATKKTGVTISLGVSGDRALATSLGTINALSADEVDRSLFTLASHVHVGSYYLQTGLQPGLAELFADAHKSGLTTSLDAGWDDMGNWNTILDVLPHVDIFLPNESEATSISGETDIISAARKLAKLCKICVVKRGYDGASLSKGDKIITAGAYRVDNPVDTTGAGDSFNAGFLHAYLSGFDLETCCKYGNACGAISVTRVGGSTACATLDEAENLIKMGR